MTPKGDILVVDDNISSLRLLSDILTAEGYKIRPADSGELTLVSAMAKPPELILLDIRMPGMDGFEVCRRLKERDETKDIPIIFISALNEVEERVEGFKLGAVDFISKPYESHELLARVKTHLELMEMRIERKRAEKALQESEERFRTVADFTYNWETWIGSDGHILYISPSCERITGFNAQEFTDNPDLFMKIVHPEDRAVYIQHLQIGTTDQICDFNFRIITKSGDARWINHLCRPVVDSKGKFLGRRSSDRDITNQKLLETQIEMHRQQLESLVYERTAELEVANKLLRQEIKKCTETEELLRKQKSETEEKARSLEELNTALKVLLKRREDDRKDLEDKVMLSVQQLVMPALNELRSAPMDSKSKTYIGIIESGLKEITTPFLMKLSSDYRKLTAREIQVLNMIREGKNTKEMANLLNISSAAINRHRNHLRKKFGLLNSKTNLQTFLSSLA